MQYIKLICCHIKKQLSSEWHATMYNIDKWKPVGMQSLLLRLASVEHYYIHVIQHEYIFVNKRRMDNPKTRTTLGLHR